MINEVITFTNESSKVINETRYQRKTGGHNYIKFENGTCPSTFSFIFYYLTYVWLTGGRVFVVDCNQSVSELYVFGQYYSTLYGKQVEREHISEQLQHLILHYVKAPCVYHYALLED